MAFEAQGARLLTVVGQEPFRAAWWREKLRPGFPVLADPVVRVQGLYGVARQLVVHDEWVNVPAAFVIDRQGVLRQAHVGRGFNDRVTTEQLLDEVSALPR
ncbi:MAG: redoxin domain-containing protein [Armatimonadetes bacterium]|nr:redoxin domain-containing protein [Armatimonadota bacterium]